MGRLAGGVLKSQGQGGVLGKLLTGDTTDLGLNLGAPMYLKGNMGKSRTHV